MNVKYEFVVREIMGDYILVPVGESALFFSGMITTTEVGAFLWKHLPEVQCEDELVDLVLAEYEVDRETAKSDTAEFMQKLRDMGILE